MTREGSSGEYDSRTISVIAGPNGAGKSTFVENYLKRYVDCDEFLNADLIDRGLKNLTNIYLPIVDDACVLNGAISPPEVIWRRSEGNEWMSKIDTWQSIQSFEGG